MIAVAYWADAHAIQGRVGAPVFEDLAIADAAGTQQVNTALRVIAIAKRADLHEDCPGFCLFFRIFLWR